MKYTGFMLIVAKLTFTGSCLCLVPGTQSERSPLHLHSVVASQWKPHHAISSPHRFLWLQNPNHSVTTPALSLKLSPSLSLQRQSDFSPFSSCLTARKSGRPNLIELSAGPNCSHQIGPECEHNEWFTGCCWPQDSSSFTHGVHKRLVFSSPTLTSNLFRPAAVGEFLFVFLYIDLILVEDRMIVLS